MDISDTLDENRKQLVDKASEFAENAKPYLNQAKPYIDRAASYAKTNPVEAMVMAGIGAFVLGELFRRR
jgi:ElaB/YqjD/DUF883 family membrane-anchored ribosome-binding protein